MIPTSTANSKSPTSVVSLNAKHNVGRLTEKTQFRVFQPVGGQSFSRQSFVALDLLGFRQLIE